jgi:CarD family transcriptional regulator
MFEVDEYVIHVRNGVCKVKSIGKLEMGVVDNDRLYYTLEPIYFRASTVYIPVDNEALIARRIISKQEAADLLKIIPTIEELAMENDKAREAMYDQLIKKCDCAGWVKVIKTLYHRREDRLDQGKKVLPTEDKYLRLVGECLFGELAIVLGLEKDKVEEMVLQKMEA